MNYRYVESGLENVELLGGFRVEDDPDYGSLVSFDDADELHREIALALAHDQPYLKNDELRYLRKYLRLSQACMAPLLGVTEQTVSLWERGEHSVPDAQSLLLRQFVLETAIDSLNRPLLRDVQKYLSTAQRLDVLRFAHDVSGWHATHRQSPCRNDLRTYVQAPRADTFLVNVTIDVEETRNTTLILKDEEQYTVTELRKSPLEFGMSSSAIVYSTGLASREARGVSAKIGTH